MIAIQIPEVVKVALFRDSISLHLGLAGPKKGTPQIINSI